MKNKGKMETIVRKGKGNEKYGGGGQKYQYIQYYPDKTHLDMGLEDMGLICEYNLNISAYYYH